MEIKQETAELIQPLKGQQLVEETVLEELSDEQGAAKSKEITTHRPPPPPALPIALPRGWSIKCCKEIGEQGRGVSGVKPRHFSLNV